MIAETAEGSFGYAIHETMDVGEQDLVVLKKRYSALIPGSTEPDHASVPSTREILALSTWRHPALSSASQAGLINNLNDGVAWGLFPLFFAASGLGVADIGWLIFIYPFTWGVLQLWTGAWSDRVGRKRLIVGGMLIQALALGVIAMANGFVEWLGAGVLLGLGTAMVYPTLLATIGRHWSIASSRMLPMPSFLDGRMNTSKAAR